MSVEKEKLELGGMDTSQAIRKPLMMRPSAPPSAVPLRPSAGPIKPIVKSSKQLLREDEKKALGDIFEGLIGTKGACIVDDKIKVLGKVPLTELNSTLKSLNTGIYAVVLDGIVEKELVEVAEKSTVKHVVCMDTRVKPLDSRINIVTAAGL